MNEIVNAIELLQSRLMTLEFHLDIFKYEFDREVDATIERNKKAKGKPKLTIEAFDSMQQYKLELRDELRGAILLGRDHGIDLPTCRRIVLLLESGDDPIPLVFDAAVELDQLLEKVLKPAATSDPKMEHAIKLFTETDIPWSRIRIDVGCTEDSQKGFESNVRRYFKKTRGKELSSVHSRETGMKPNRNK